MHLDFSLQSICSLFDWRHRFKVWFKVPLDIQSKTAIIKMAFWSLIQSLSDAASHCTNHIINRWFYGWSRIILEWSGSRRAIWSKRHWISAFALCNIFTNFLMQNEGLWTESVRIITKLVLTEQIWCFDPTGCD